MVSSNDISSDNSVPRAPQGAIPAELRAEIERAGYYPDLVVDSLATALVHEEVVDFVVHHEATFDRDELRRHATVLAITPTRLVMQHTDEHPADEMYNTPYASSVTEAVRLATIDTVIITRIVTDPAAYKPDALPSEVMLTVGWGAVRRMELEPANCGDPACEADHGFSGSVSADDLALRFSSAADGADSVQRALSFASFLANATGAGATPRRA
ncbi:DUF5998 family protein [Candidatus Nanopelagicales bacterium]|nr:DUF5998 family protein [Candidatus Nanopelagicales bacterium]